MSKDCFGLEWADGDDVCESCKEEIHCRDATKRGERERRAPTNFRPNAYVPPPSSSFSNYGEVSRSYSVNKMYLSPMEDETWYDRLFKNMLSGALEGIGGETMIFFKHYKFPPSLKKKE